jgi:hypothetical protein
MLSMFTSFGLFCKKSRLAGFFLLLLLACSPQQPEQTKTQAAVQRILQQAIKAEQQGLVSQALPLYKQAVALGDASAVLAVLRLQPEATTAELQQWLLQQPLNQRQLAPFWAELGLWQQLTKAQQQELQLPFSGLHFSPKSCVLSLQPVLSNLASARQWQLLLTQWQQDRQLSSLPLCWLAPVFIDSTTLNCSEQTTQRIQCHLPALKQQLKGADFHQVLLLAGKGGASYNNGLLQLPEQSSLALLRHELSHAFGFLDEYALLPQVAKAECKPGRLTPNLLFDKNDLTAYQQFWQLEHTELQITPVASCNNAALQAYRVVAGDTHMQHYELQMPDLYLQLIRKQLQKPELLMPASYYFAYLARQQQDWPAWQHWMQHAAGLGYPPAQKALEQTNQTDKSPAAFE